MNEGGPYFDKDRIRSRKEASAYFDEDYVRSRHGYLKEVRELAELGPPEPAEDWDAIYSFSGPELTIEEAPSEKLPYNQSRFRLETACKIAREVTAVRLHKKAEEVTPDDIRTAGPSIYFDGYAIQNLNLRNSLDTESLEAFSAFPTDKVVISGPGTVHSGDQIAKFPSDILATSRKIAIVTDLYHLPRVKRYIGSRFDVQHIPTEKLVFTFPEESRISMFRGLSEARKLYPYAKKGDLSRE